MYKCAHSGGNRKFPLASLISRGVSMNVDVNVSYVRAWKRIQFFSLGLLLVLSCLPAFSQVNLGRISGT